MLARDALVWRFWLVCGLTAAGLGGSLTDCSAQQPRYRGLQYRPPTLQNNTREIKDRQQLKNRIVSGTSQFDKAAMDRYYLHYLLPAFTDPSQLGELAQRRQELLGDLARARGPAANYLRANLKRYMTGITNNLRGANTNFNFHPAVRFNAMLILGDLNSAEKNMADGRRYPTPDRNMVQVMLTELAQKDQIDAVRVAALVGLLRHAKLQHATGNPPMPFRKETADQMLAIITQITPPAGRSSSGHHWMRRRAIEILGALRAIGAHDSYNTAVVSIVNNPDEDMLVRCTAAEALALLNPQGRAQPDYKLTSMQLGALAAQCVRADLDWIDDLKLQRELKKLIEEGGNMMGGGGGGGMDMMGGGMMGEMGAPGDMGDDMGDLMAGMGGGSIGSKPKDPELDLARRRLKYKLLSIQRGLKTIAKVDSENPEVKQVLQLVNAMMQATDPPENDPTLDALAKELRRNVRTLERLTANVVPRPENEPASAAPISARPGGAPRPTSVGATTATKRGG